MRGSSGSHAPQSLPMRGTPVDVPDPLGRTPLALAIKACVDSYWTELCSPESVKMLLEAGASTSAITLPSGHAEVDALLEPHIDRRQY